MPSSTDQHPSVSASGSSVGRESLPLPSLGHQLSITALKSHRDFDSTGWYRIAAKPSQRWIHFAIAFVGAFALAIISLIILYLPDFIADYSHRSDDFLHFFYRFLPILAALVAITATISVILKKSVCFVHPKDKKILCTASKLSPRTIGDAVSLDAISVIELTPPSSFTRHSRLIAIVHERETILADTYGETNDIAALFAWLNSLKVK